MRQFLITGATGNIGTEVIKSLETIGTNYKIIAGVRNIAKARQLFPDFKNLDYRDFDFEDPQTFDKALDNIDCIFLLRPPHISDVDKYFKPLIQTITKKGIKRIIFLSVQGAEKSKVIPHNKIERLIRDSGLDFIFLRPSYFMQNLTTNLLRDIQFKGQIILPAGKAKFNWIDIRNIGQVTAILLDNFDLHKNREIELTGHENLDFYAASEIMSAVTNKKIEFVNVNPFKFYRLKRRDGLNSGLIIVMTMLHFLPRLQKDPRISDNYEILTGRKPTSLKEFMEREKINWNAL
jgi:uncharacterized protein YbjT (DUF2867 family)